MIEAATLTGNVPTSVNTNKYRAADIDTLFYNSFSKSPFVLGKITDEEQRTPKPANLPKKNIERNCGTTVNFRNLTCLRSDRFIKFL
ncbi:MAG: hypothetical protein ABR980_01510 [Ignavibacteriaceae bacterium]